ncbi:MAG: hypothetical protein LKJ80_04630, partial [Oscillibacter sp.]|nr:hypothetical protein [Oscillibacter sp.]
MADGMGVDAVESVAGKLPAAWKSRGSAQVKSAGVPMLRTANIYNACKYSTSAAKKTDLKKYLTKS